MRSNGHTRDQCVRAGRETDLDVIRQGSNPPALEVERNSATEINACQLVLYPGCRYTRGKAGAKKLHRRCDRVWCDVEETPSAEVEVVKHVMGIAGNVIAIEAEVRMNRHHISHYPGFDELVSFLNGREEARPHAFHDEQTLFLRLLGIDGGMATTKQVDAHIDRIKKSRCWGVGGGG